MKFLKFAICYLIYPFSFLSFRRKKRYAFGGARGSFNDNSKYLFIYCQENHKDIDAAWLSIDKETVKRIKSLGFKAYYILSVKGFYHALTSKYWFFNTYTTDIMFCLSGSAKCVNLWHGVGLKRIEFNVTSGKLADRYVKKKLKEVFYQPGAFRRPDFFLSSTPFQTYAFAKAFRINESQCLELGYPRNHILTDNEEERTKFISAYEPTETKSIISKLRSGYEKTFIYMPTWRDSQLNIFAQSFDLDALQTIMSEKNSLMVLKPHSNTIVDKSVFHKYPNIMLLDSHIDIYAILPYTDVLITDYSSVLYDYILMDGKDVILYLYDYNEYVKERDFFYPFDENVTGKSVYNFKELCDCIRSSDYKMDETHRQEIINKFWGDTVTKNSCEEILDAIQQTSENQ